MLGRVKSAKPEEEIIVTVGTEVKEVLPAPGKAIKRVTVKPTPSQIKSVTPAAAPQEVVPDSGKLLSKVTVAGDADLAPENVRKGTDIFGVLGSFDNSAGAYVWKKYNVTSGEQTFIGYIVSDNESEYPDGGTQDGYYYEKVVEGAKIATGTVSVGVIDDAKTIQHGLGKTPTIIFAVLGGACATYYENKDYGGAASDSASTVFNYISNVNSDSFKAMLGGGSSYMTSGTMKWIAVAE